MSACPTAPPRAMTPRRSPSSVEQNGSTGTKSIAPAMVVFNPSVGKRRIGLMPDIPAVSFCQFSALPAPSDVTTPMPVTTTSGRPALSCVDSMFLPSRQRFDQRHAFAAPVTDAGHDHLPQRAVHCNLTLDRIGGRI